MQSDSQRPGANNPYAPPAEAPPGWAEVAALHDNPAPSRVPFVFGILSLVFSSITFLSGGLIAISLWAVKVFGGRAGADHWVAAMMSGYFLVITLMAVALFILGFGQLRFRPWARRPTLYWAALALLLLAAFPVVCGIFAGTGLGPKGVGGLIVVGILGFLVLAPYPILLLIFFTKLRVKYAMREGNTDLGPSGISTVGG